MILKNKNGKEREMELLLEINKDNNRYIVYRDYLTKNIYSGKISRKKLKCLTEEECIYINNILERMEG